MQVWYLWSMSKLTPDLLLNKGPNAAASSEEDEEDEEALRKAIYTVLRQG